MARLEKKRQENKTLSTAYGHPSETDTVLPRETHSLTTVPQCHEETSTELGSIHKCTHFLSNITVEPMAAFLVMSVMLSNMATQNLNLEKACRVNLNYTMEVCNALERRQTDNYTHEETEVQKLTSYIAAWKSCITAIIPSIMILFVGAYSDATGRRKIFIILPAIGELFACLGNMVNLYYFFELPLEFLAFTEAIFPALGGGFCAMFLGVYTYISDVTTLESRTFRMGVASFCISVAFPAGMSLSGIMLTYFGFYGVYVFAAVILCMNISYGIFLLKDPERRRATPTERVKLFNLSRVRETVSVLCAGEPARNRRILLFVGMICMLFGPMYGEITILYLNTRYRFNWEAVSFSMFLTYSFIIHLIGTMFSIFVLSRVLKWHDSMLGIISTLSKVAGACVAALAQTSTVFYLGPLVEILNGTSLLSVRSMLSKLVSSEEQGKLNSVVGLTETMMPLIYSPLYVQVYRATFEVFPGSVFFISAILTLIPAVAFIYLFVEHRRGLRKLRIQDKNTSDGE